MRLRSGGYGTAQENEGQFAIKADTSNNSINDTLEDEAIHISHHLENCVKVHRDILRSFLKK